MNIIKDMEFDAINAINKSLLEHGQLTFTPRGIAKAMSAGEGTGTGMTDLDTLQGGRAITVENIDTELKVTAEDRRDLVWYNLLRKKPIYAVLDQWMELSDHGANSSVHAFGKFRTESAFPTVSDVTLSRKVDSTKFLRDMRDLTHVMEQVSTYAEKHQIINRAAAITILEAAELATVFGNAAAMPTEYDGLYTKLRNAYETDGYTNAIVDCRETGSASYSKGGAITEELLDTGALNIRNNFGMATHMVMPLKVKSNLNKILPVSRRVMLPAAQQQAMAGLLLGQPATGFFSDYAYAGWPDSQDPHFKFVPSIDTYYPDGESPSMSAPAADFPNGTDAPAPPDTVTAAAASGTAANKFGAGDAGDYWYKAAAYDADGRSSAVSVSGAVTVAKTQKVTITVTCSDATITGIAVYRSALGAADATDCRWIGDFAVDNPVSTTAIVDENLILPGTLTALLVSNAPTTDAIDYRQLMPFVRMELPFGLNGIVGFPYLYMLYQYLRTPKLLNARVGGTFHVLYTNIRWDESTFDPTV